MSEDAGRVDYVSGQVDFLWSLGTRSIKITKSLLYLVKWKEQIYKYTQL